MRPATAPAASEEVVVTPSSGQAPDPPVRSADRPLSPQARRIVAAATTLFYERGALATSVRDITQACGLTPGSLYNHFSSKEELLHVLVRAIHLQHEEAMVEAQAEVAGDPLAELCLLVQVVVHRYATHRESARVANREYGLLTGDRLEDVVGLRHRALARVSEVLRRGQSEGVFDLDPALTPGLLATAVFDMSVHLSEWFQEGEPYTGVEIAGRYAALACRMAGASPTPELLERGRRWVDRTSSAPDGADLTPS
jgi:AcrR family transcriptional regulator